MWLLTPDFNAIETIIREKAMAQAPSVYAGGDDQEFENAEAVGQLEPVEV